MEFFQPILSGFEVVFQPSNLLYCLAGVLIGMIIGVLPGLGPTATIALLLPITYEIPPESAIILLAGIYYGAMYGGTITSVLLQLPGEAASVVTTFDGYQMARQGRAGPALGIAAIGSFIGGTVSIIGLSLLAPFLAGFALRFGPPEYTALALLGILLVSYLGTGSTVKSVMAAALGLLIATVGRDPVMGTARFTFGSISLSDGVDFVAIAMGLFGLGEIFYDLEQRTRASFATSRIGRAWVSMADWRESRGAVARGSLLGFFIGILPGGGGTLSSMASYALEKRTAREPARFGKGAIQGVAGPESANNAAATSSFIPLLTLGIPTNSVMALIFGALLLQGIPPGPTLIVQNPEIFWGVVDSMYIGNIFLLILSVPLVGLFVRLLRVRATILAPITVMVTMLGVFTVNNSPFDMWIVIFFGVVGYLMNKFGFEPGPLVLAFVLGRILETSFRQSLRIFEGDVTGFVTRPISGTILALMLVVILLPAVGFVRGRMRRRREGA
ncbi:MAG: Tripartite tricarboxylate transporter TctA family [uncultured Rubrobacteraceae bacterium]|uniref:Tripartite tricarboxylate transporter TctA family n=1 Tax=uncultured Rubrobacteraceae bacterium TaxID=349277 RepID=A0A6J4S959_9ACTN|nr:MAG: Tripartite tricarboxylate transporter TctA family [uncultured Rubrobacteraceae bacterium]